MKLSLDYLKTRHDYWKYEIGEKRIWNPLLFKDITIQIRPKSKSYNGMFCRKRLLVKGKRIPVDRIFIYKNSEDFNPVFLDSVLVHEMIHQYIFQTKTKDTSTHGKIFRSFMAKINLEFKDRLNIRVSDHNPSVPLKGPGKNNHLLALSWTDKDCYCCVVNPSKFKFFDQVLKKYKSSGTVKGYIWAQSNDVHFDRYVRCTKTLHGIKNPILQMTDFCKKYNITRFPLSS